MVESEEFVSRRKTPSGRRTPRRFFTAKGLVDGEKRDDNDEKSNDVEVKSDAKSEKTKETEVKSEGKLKKTKDTEVKSEDKVGKIKDKEVKSERKHDKTKDEERTREKTRDEVKSHRRREKTKEKVDGKSERKHEKNEDKKDSSRALVKAKGRDKRRDKRRDTRRHRRRSETPVEHENSRNSTRSERSFSSDEDSSSESSDSEDEFSLSVPSAEDILHTVLGGMGCVNVPIFAQKDSMIKFNTEGDKTTGVEVNMKLPMPNVNIMERWAATESDLKDKIERMACEVPQKFNGGQRDYAVPFQVLEGRMRPAQALPSQAMPSAFESLLSHSDEDFGPPQQHIQPAFAPPHANMYPTMGVPHQYQGGMPQYHGGMQYHHGAPYNGGGPYMPPPSPVVRMNDPHFAPMHYGPGPFHGDMYAPDAHPQQIFINEQPCLSDDLVPVDDMPPPGPLTGFDLTRYHPKPRNRPNYELSKPMLSLDSEDSEDVEDSEEDDSVFNNNSVPTADAKADLSMKGRDTHHEPQYKAPTTPIREDTKKKKRLEASREKLKRNNDTRRNPREERQVRTQALQAESKPYQNHVARESPIPSVTGKSTSATVGTDTTRVPTFDESGPSFDGQGSSIVKDGDLSEDGPSFDNRFMDPNVDVVNKMKLVVVGPTFDQPETKFESGDMHGPSFDQPDVKNIALIEKDGPSFKGIERQASDETGPSFDGRRPNEFNKQEDLMAFEAMKKTPSQDEAPSFDQQEVGIADGEAVPSFDNVSAGGPSFDGPSLDGRKTAQPSSASFDGSAGATSNTSSVATDGAITEEPPAKVPSTSTSGSGSLALKKASQPLQQSRKFHDENKTLHDNGSKSLPMEMPFDHVPRREVNKMKPMTLEKQTDNSGRKPFSPMVNTNVPTSPRNEEFFSPKYSATNMVASTKSQRSSSHFGFEESFDDDEFFDAAMM